MSFKPVKIKPKQADLPKFTFEKFFVVWAQMQTPVWDIPDLHFDIMEFLTSYASWENNTGVLQIFRGAGKSTIVGLFVTWMLTQDPSRRFLILSADKKTAGKITTDVQSIIQRHPLAKHLHGEEGAWRSDTLVVHGSTDGRNPSVTSWGIGSNVTGSRADWIIYDDVEVPKNSKTDGERESLRTRLDEPTHILVPGGKELFVGTPHSYESIYPEILGESAVEEPFRTGAASLKIPIMTDVTGEFPKMEGTPIWIERFPLPEIQKRANGSKTKGHFMSQYLLLPYNPDETVLDPSLIAVYSHELDIHSANGGTIAKIGPYRVMGVTAFWDPAMSSIQTDDSVLSIVYTSDDGHYFIHRAIKLEGDGDEQCVQAIRELKAVNANHVRIETNGIGNLLPAIFRKHAVGKGITCEGKHTHVNKLQKIMEAYEVALSTGRIHAHTSVMNSPFRTQLRDFNHKTAGRRKDDFIDSVAEAIIAQPIRIQAGFAGNRTFEWGGGDGGGIEVEMDWQPF